LGTTKQINFYSTLLSTFMHSEVTHTLIQTLTHKLVILQENSKAPASMQCSMQLL